MDYLFDITSSDGTNLLLVVWNGTNPLVVLVPIYLNCCIAVSFACLHKGFYLKKFTHDYNQYSKHWESVAEAVHFVVSVAASSVLAVIIQWLLEATRALMLHLPITLLPIRRMRVNQVRQQTCTSWGKITSSSITEAGQGCWSPNHHHQPNHQSQ